MLTSCAMQCLCDTASSLVLTSTMGYTGTSLCWQELMMSYKKEASEGRLELSCMAMKLHAEEMEEGDERPDLDLGLVVSPMGRR